MPITECSVCGKPGNTRTMKGCRECASPICERCARETNYICFRCGYDPDF